MVFKLILAVISILLSCTKPMVVSSGVAILGPTRALAQASTYLALASKTDKNHVIIY